jgi:uncharacterized protein YaaR (DUF327 family)
MDKVDFTASSLLNASLLPGMKQDTKKTELKGKVQKPRRTFFSELLEKSGGTSGELGPLKELAPSEEALTELMDAVHSAGSDLIDRPFHDEIIKYKKAVRDFIHYVVENGYTVEKTKSLVQNPQVRRRGETKVHVQIQVLDRKLEELAAAILSGQADQLERISKIDEIKGLLVDLTITGAIRERDD